MLLILQCNNQKNGAAAVHEVNEQSNMDEPGN